MSAATRLIARLPARALPFADAASAELPLPRLLRLSLFQLTVGMASVLLTGTLNRVMIVELGLPAALVALMVAVPLLAAPFRALVGHRSDAHRSVLGWRRVPYIWFGTLLMFGGFAILPFALLLMTGGGQAPAWYGEVGAALGFLLVGFGMHTTQTAGLALATDLAPEATRPRVVALLYVMLLVGMLASSLLVGALIADFSPTRLVGVVQGAGLVALVVNTAALWKQEARRPGRAAEPAPPPFRDSWARFTAPGRVRRLLAATGLGAAAFAMQDVLLEPYGAQVLGLTPGETTVLTAIWAAGTLGGLASAARRLGAGAEPHRLAGAGATIGLLAFALVILAAPLASAALFCLGVALIGLGGGLFAVGTLTAAMALSENGHAGIALGAWGAVQATAAGGAVLAGGLLRDGVGAAAMAGRLGPALTGDTVGYTFVYHLELGLLFATLAALGPLVRRAHDYRAARFGLADLPTA